MVDFLPHYLVVHSNGLAQQPEHVRVCDGALNFKLRIIVGVVGLLFIALLSFLSPILVDLIPQRLLRDHHVVVHPLHNNQPAPRDQQPLLVVADQQAVRRAALGAQRLHARPRGRERGGGAGRGGARAPRGQREEVVGEALPALLFAGCGVGELLDLLAAAALFC